MPHTPAPQELSFKDSLHQERHLMGQIDVPIVTVSSTFLDAFPKTEPRHHTQEIVYSRAHYSQAIACLIAATRLKKSTWLIDPTNYVSASDWWKVLLTEKIAETLVRSDLLMKVRRLIENKARDQLPIHAAIKPPLLYVTQTITRPILSLHYETANIMAENRQKVFSVVTDPYVRDQYLIYAHYPEISFAVFDQDTKNQLLSKSSVKGLDRRVFVTGPPVDPRIVDTRKTKNHHHLSHRPLRLVITTGGTGTNKPEIRKLLDSLAPRLKGKTTTLQVLAYAGTHLDFKHLFEDFAQENQVKISPLSDTKAEFRLIYHQHLMQANELLIDHAFPWADAFITKPSGDMAYDAAASGAALLFLNPLGPWEEAIQQRFVKMDIGQDIPNPAHFAQQLVQLEQLSWFAQAQQNALNLSDLYLKGAETIVKTLLQL